MLKPWITPEILNKCKECDKLLKQVLNENDPDKSTEIREKFNKMRNEITKEKRKSKKEFNTAQFEKKG